MTPIVLQILILALHAIESLSVRINGEFSEQVTELKYLGIILDSLLNFKSQKQ